MNFLELASRLVKESGISASPMPSVDGQTGILGKVVTWIERAYRDVQITEKQWAFLWRQSTGTLRANTNLYTLADLNVADLRSFKTVKQDDNVVEVIKWESWDRNIASSQRDQTSRTIRFITIRPDRTVQVHPIPSEEVELSIEYYARPHKLVASTDSPVIPEEYTDAIVFKGLMYYAAHENDDFLYQQASMEYEKWLSILSEDQLPKIDFL